MTWAVDIRRDWPVADCRSDVECGFLLESLLEDELIERLEGGKEYRLTFKGWSAVEPLAASTIRERCFVAMSFKDDMLKVYNEGIAPAITDCGYDPRCLIETPDSTDLIDNTIIAEVRRAEFVVADVTYHSHGVYFEAGFAKALGRPVIFTCREDHWKERHFDTQHYPHLRWSSIECLRGKLAEWIEAQVGKRVGR